jgi:hypothetical protein
MIASKSSSCRGDWWSDATRSHVSGELRDDMYQDSKNSKRTRLDQFQTIHIVANLAEAIQSV